MSVWTVHLGGQIGQLLQEEQAFVQCSLGGLSLLFATGVTGTYKCSRHLCRLLLCHMLTAQG